MFESAKCDVVPDDAATDAGVAGAGVLLSFIITAGLALLLSGIIILHEIRQKSESRILRKLLSSFSDQQIITGIGIQSVGLAKLNTMVPYHFFIIWLLSLLSMTTHLGTLLALVNDFKRDWVLRWLRQLLMFINLAFSCIFGVYVLIATQRGLEPTLAIGCAFRVSAKPAPSNVTISIVGTIAVIAGSCIVFAAGVWYLHSSRQKWTKYIQIGGLVVLIALAVGAAVRVIQVSQAFGTTDVGFLRDGAEKDWSFGQLLPMLLLLLPLVSALEIIRGEIQVPCPVGDDQDPLIGGNGNQYERESFQPNPFWGQSYKLASIPK